MNTESGRILLVEDDELFLQTLAHVLEREGYEVTTADSGAGGLELIKENFFDLVITDVKLPGGMDGIDLLERASQQYHFRSKSIVITGYDDKEAPIRAIRLRVDDYIYKPFQLEQFTHAVRKSMQQLRIEREAAHYREMSIRDGLTNLFNHRYFHEIAEREIQRARRYGSYLSLILADIDDFKSFNDSHGHPMGDVALRSVARIFEAVLRGSDLAFRYGGEELAVLLSDTDAKGGAKTGDRLRQAVAEHQIQVAHDRLVGVTISLGIAAFPDDAQSKEELVLLADQALYRAKHRGKNQVAVHGDGEDEDR